MHTSGWRPFWTALWAGLLVLLPLAGGTLLLTRQAARARTQTAQPQSGVAVALPRKNHQATLLLCLAGDQPGFVLCYLNASQNCLHLLTLPGELDLPAGAAGSTLAQCYHTAGPARCREALTTALALPEDTLYLALAPERMQALAAPFGTLRVSFSGTVPAETLHQAGLTAAVQTMTAAEAARQLTQLAEQADPYPLACARAAVWEAFFRQKLEQLPAALPDALRKQSPHALTDLAAQDYYRLEETLEFLANNSAEIQAAALPGAQQAGRYTLTDASQAAVQSFFNLSPACAQSASDKEP